MVLRTIEKSQLAGKLYVFLPEFYLENGIYLFQALWNYFLPLTTNGNTEGKIHSSIVIELPPSIIQGKHPLKVLLL